MIARQQWSRRAVLGGACACAFHARAGAADARIHPAAMTALAPVGFRPTERDERGMWQSCERLEEEIAGSNLLLPSPAFQRYAKQVVDRLVGDRAGETRVYVVHDPDFNASMFPTGMMLVNTGLLARMRDEAQFASILGHECGHYLRRHSLSRWRDTKAKTGVMAFVQAGASVGAGITAGAGGAGANWMDLANAINASLVLSILSYSREHEREADAYGVKLIEEAGYPPEAAAMVWEQLIAERKASAAGRRKKYRDRSLSALSTHPASALRLADLSVFGRELRDIVVTGRRYDAQKARWDAAVAPLRADLLAEQVRLNDPGASLYLVHAMAADGWTGLLRYNEGEVYRLRDEAGDAQRAATSYAAAIGHADAPAEAWRAHGYALLKQGRGEEGKAALGRYLAERPGANDAGMIRFSINQ